MCSWETGNVILQLFDTSVPEMLEKMDGDYIINDYNLDGYN